MTNRNRPAETAAEELRLQIEEINDALLDPDAEDDTYAAAALWKARDLLIEELEALGA